MTDPKIVQMPPQRAVPPGDGGDGGDVDRRLREVELDVREIKTGMTHLATKDDLSKMEARQTRWLVSVLIAAVIALAAVMTFVK